MCALRIGKHDYLSISKKLDEVIAAFVGSSLRWKLKAQGKAFKRQLSSTGEICLSLQRERKLEPVDQLVGTTAPLPNYRIELALITVQLNLKFYNFLPGTHMHENSTIVCES